MKSSILHKTSSYESIRSMQSLQWFRRRI